MTYTRILASGRSTTRLSALVSKQSGQRWSSSGSSSKAPQDQQRQRVNTYGEYQFRKSIERGRAAYSVRNVATAVGLFGACAGIYFYSLNAVKQEDFSDIPMPPEPSAEERAKYESGSK
ncbi:hypothetical protein LPJ53_000174 [Coemansia erecta]|uniref:Cytochrome c oxidase assembly factor 3 n=1 Tax=Coemansia erecta TaxID=147472 RepID=A0A9W8CTG7_9FUNG|nr:hypothetical protein LPJ53_000174 [Coemansia erecta]